MEIIFRISGKEVNPGSLENPLAAAVLYGRSKSVKKAVGTLKCAEHGGYPVIIFAGRNVENLACDVGGCCSKFVKGVERRISYLL
ncbi:MAG: hypothetical protein D3910_02015 [Candidatus Electrothrix sp. ATG2]|nr:hypothetical protein [Candidatus Electrothrix sp. ATG2]